MPWIDQEKCVQCNVCVTKCPAHAISASEGNIIIHMEKCIRCGICHRICPQKAVRHDSEKIPSEVISNVERTTNFMDLCARYLADDAEKSKCLERMIKHYKKEKVVAEKTLEELEKLKERHP